MSYQMKLLSCDPSKLRGLSEKMYHIDYGAKAAAYVDAFMQNINWTHVAQRYVRRNDLTP